MMRGSQSLSHSGVGETSESACSKCQIPQRLRTLSAINTGFGVLLKSNPRSETVEPSASPLTPLTFSKFVCEEVWTWIWLTPAEVNKLGSPPTLKLLPAGAPETVAVKRVSRSRTRSVVMVIDEGAGPT